MSECIPVRWIFSFSLQAYVGRKILPPVHTNKNYQSVERATTTYLNLFVDLLLLLLVYCTMHQEATRVTTCTSRSGVAPSLVPWQAEALWPDQIELLTCNLHPFHASHPRFDARRRRRIRVELILSPAPTDSIHSLPLLVGLSRVANTRLQGVFVTSKHHPDTYCVSPNDSTPPSHRFYISPLQLFYILQGFYISTSPHRPFISQPCQ